MSRLGLSALAATVLVAASPAASQTGSVNADARPPVIDALVDCRKIGDPTERLACFDRTSEQLVTAKAAGDVVVVDRQEVKKAQRSAFGFNIALPSVFKSSGKPDGDKKDSKAESDEMDTLTAVAKRVWQSPGGAWNFELEDGAVWKQTDSFDASRSFKNGVTVEIKKGKLSGYFLKANGALMRARRES